MAAEATLTAAPLPEHAASLPDRLAKNTGAALVPIYCVRTRIGHYEIRLLPEVPLPEGPAWEVRVTQQLNDILEAQVRQCPEQWTWNHRRWRPQPVEPGA